MKNVVPPPDVSILRDGRILLVCAFLLLLAGCNALESIRTTLLPATPHERYERSLIDAGLEGTALARAWVDASQQALQDALPVGVPFQETVYLPATEATAVGYRIDARRGQRLIIDIDSDGFREGRVFADLFAVPADPARAPERVASAADSLFIAYESNEDRSYILRVQPELLHGGRYTLTVRYVASLDFPVAGVDGRAIRSFFGDSRDGGRRQHHGVDIFAPRGTPVLAAASGYVTNVGANRLGGNVVSVWDARRGQSYYYAHLDTQLVRRGMRVQPGDTLGLVGNTGNARTTPPHLHFGIYVRGRGPVDPYPFLHTAVQSPAAPAFALDKLGTLARVAGNRVNLRQSPDDSAPVTTTMSQHTPVRVLGGTGGWYRVRLPDGTAGFVFARGLEAADRPIRNERVASSRPVFDGPNSTSVMMDSLMAGLHVPVRGRFGDFLYVETPNGRSGWMRVD